MPRNLAEALSITTDALETSTRIVNACADAKARDISVLDASKVSDLFSYYIIASGNSDRQVQGITNRILDTLDSQGLRPYSMEGIDQGHWVILDYGDVLVHVFYEPLRSHYDLEGLWAKAGRLQILKKTRGSELALKT